MIMMRPSRSLFCSLAASCVLVAASAAAHAQTVTIEGTSFDSILDGFPGLADLDGTPDFGGNSLAVGFKSGATAERAFGEFPLASLSGVAVSSVSSATLTFNIDDVLSTFGPGTEFDGTSSSPIDVAIYLGDGIVGLDDWGRGTTVASVATGSITDDALRNGGPAVFTADVTQALRDLLTGGASHLGVEMSTTDDPTGASLDDLGIGASGPPGVGGARLPYLTVEVVVPTPTPSPAPTPEPSAQPTTSPGTPTPDPTNVPATPTPEPTSSGPTPTPQPTGSIPTPSPAPTVGGPTPGPQPTAPLETPGPGTPTPSPSGTPAPSTTPTPAPSPSATPIGGQKIVRPQGGPCVSSHLGSGSGDQLVSPYERGTTRATFLNVRNGVDTATRIEIAVYDESLLPSWVGYRTLPARGRIVLDLESVDDGATLPERGVLFVSSVDDEGSPVVTRALSGTATIANLETGSAWGGTTIARRAVEAGAAQTLWPTLGSAIDGTRVFYEQLQPEALQLPAYYALDGAGGNAPATLVFLSFRDVPREAPLVVAESTAWDIDARTSEGTAFDVSHTTVDGMRTLGLDVLLGTAALDVGGSLLLEVEPAPGQNRVIFFEQSLAGFGIGFPLPLAGEDRP